MDFVQTTLDGESVKIINVTGSEKNTTIAYIDSSNNLKVKVKPVSWEDFGSVQNKSLSTSAIVTGISVGVDGNVTSPGPIITSSGSIVLGGTLKTLSSYLRPSWDTSTQVTPNIIPGKYIDNTTGNLNSTTAYNVSAPIYVPPNKRFMLLNTSATYSAQIGGIYNNNGVWISAIANSYYGNVSSRTYTMPSDGYYIKINYSSAYTQWVGVELDKQSKIYNKIDFWGDSITLGTGSDIPYPTIVSNILGCSGIINGVGGRRITGAGGLWTAAKSANPTADIIVLLGGVNDAVNNVTIGDISGTDTNTFYGALNNLCEYFSTYRFWQPMILVTPLASNSGGAAISGYVDAIKNIGKKFNLKVIDLNENVGFSATLNNVARVSLFADNTHPNAWGTRIMASYIATQLISI